MDQISQEWTRLVDLCSDSLSGVIPRDKRAPVHNADIDWEKLYNLARIHRVLPLLYDGLIKGNWNQEDIPGPWMRRLKKYVENITIHNLNGLRELLRLMKLFRQQGIEVIPYKGALLAETVYGNQALRSSSDIDILIRASDLERTGQILLNEGYVPEFKVYRILRKLHLSNYSEFNYDLYENRSRIHHVEPHWVLGPRMYQNHIRTEAVASLTRKETFFGQEINKLTPEGLLITTAAHHGGTDNWRYLKHVTDMAAILNRYSDEINWDKVFQFCQVHKIEDLVMMGIILSGRLFNSPVPDHMLYIAAERRLMPLAADILYKMANMKKRPHWARLFVMRIVFQWKLRQSTMTKLKIVYYHLIHFVLRPFIIRYIPRNRVR